MARNINSPYARHAKGHLSDSQWYIVSPSSTAQYADLGGIYPPDAEDGIPRVYTSVAAVFAQANAIVSGRNDKIYLTPDYTTALTAADLLNAETNGVTISPLQQDQFGQCTVFRAAATLPQGTHAAIFTVTGRVKLIDIIGTVTTVLPSTANATKLTAYPTAAGLASVDLCGTLDITADAVGTVYNITGTFATALVGASNGAAVYQAAPTTIEAGAIHLDCAGSMATGAIKWSCRYIPLDPGARIVAA